MGSLVICVRPVRQRFRFLSPENRAGRNLASDLKVKYLAHR